MKIASRLAVVGMLAAGGILVAAAPAAALPGCFVKTVGNGGEVRCTSIEYYQVRVKILCESDNGDHTLYGPWRNLPGAGVVSSRTCLTGQLVELVEGEVRPR